MDRFPRRAALVALAIALALVLPAHAQSVRVPGTGVRMTPPPGFVRSERFAGFENGELASSIMVTEIPGPVSEVRKGMTRKGLASRGMLLIDSETVLIGADEALLLHVSQRSEGVDYFKWILVGGPPDRAVMVVGAFPADASELSDPMRRAVLSASWSEPDERLARRYEGLPFRVDPAPGLRLADRMGNLLIFTESGNVAPGNRDMAVLVVGNSIGAVEVGDDLERFSRERMFQTHRLKEVRAKAGSAIVIDSLSGYELTGEGVDAQDGRPVGIYQLILADGTTYYVAQGLVTPSRLPKLLPVFRRVTSTFRRTPENVRPRITQ